ncbi:DUF1697 domain-containing protein [Arthrobacter crystallopoietes]|uniref:DUF1697 domain-containing protein n=1 Tax=Crystallibacter crystallopoietes TaxID=37928 RepID=UPI0011110DAC|nr:DUF1697 domain-containing protein [Arthrobacter crystallopoietes]
MTTYAIFLRGINVGGINIKMAELKAALAELPLHDVRTLLASGNIVCASDGPAEEVKQLVEAKLRERFGYDAWVVVLSAERLDELVAACPYPADNAGVHAYVTVTSDPSELQELHKAAAAADGDGILLGPEAMAWTAAKGGTLDSPVNKLVAHKRFKSTTTTRNLRTMLKVLAAAG